MILNQVVAKHDFQIVYRKLSLVEFIFKIFNCENQPPTQLMDVFLFAGMNSWMDNAPNVFNLSVRE